MDIKSIVEEYLRKNKFDGLFSNHFDCGCEISDLMPCNDLIPDCEPGYKVPCNDDGSCDGLCDWHIGPNYVLSLVYREQNV